MDEIIRPFGLLIALAFTMFLVVLRFQAELFGVAEYADNGPDGRPTTRLRRRLSWYLVGFLIILTMFTIYPGLAEDLFVGLGDKGGAVFYGIILGVAGSGLAVAVALMRYGHLRLPPVSSYPVAMINALGTAFMDEVTFRGAVLGFLILAGLDAWLAIVIETLIYGLATRLGAPGRDRSLFVLALVLGVVTGWATIKTGGIGAAFIGHSISRFAIFLTTGHAGQPLAKGREVEEIEKRRRIPEGWSIVGAMRDSINRER